MSRRGEPTTPVGSNGLQPVGSPNRVRRRAGQAAPSMASLQQFSTPQNLNSRTNLTSPSSATGSRTTFAERVYRSTERRKATHWSPEEPPLFSGSPTPRSQLGAASPLRTPTHTRTPGSASRYDTTPNYAENEYDEYEDDNQNDDAKTVYFTPTSALPRGMMSGGKRPPPQPRFVTQPAQPAPTSAIPTSVLDLPSQRTYALAIGVGLVAWKVYDAVCLSVSGGISAWLFIKWSVLDTLLWYFGWRLHIPRFSISGQTMWILIALSVFLDVNLFWLRTSLLVLAVKPVALGFAGSCARFVQRIPLIGQRLIGDSELLIDTFELDDEHILGRHTIHVLPHSLAHMNTQGRGFCIDEQARLSEPWYWKYTSSVFAHHSNQNTRIPLLINGTQPASIVYAHTSFETGQRQLHAVRNIGALHRDVSTAYPTLGNWVLATYYLPISTPGAYELVSVKDAKGLEFRTALHAPPTIVVSCPTARLQWRADVPRGADNFVVHSRGEATICQRASSSGEGADPAYDDGLMEAIAMGYEPLEMTIVRLVNGRREVIGLDDIQPRVSDDAAATDKIDGSDLSETQRAAISKWAKYRTRRLTYTLTDAFLKPGEYVYKLENVRDAANHTVRLSDAAGAHGMFNGEVATADKSQYLSRIQVYGRPAATWASSPLTSGNEQLRLSSDKLRKSRYDLPVKLSGQAPWTVDYEIIDGDATERQTVTFATAKDAAIIASAPGTYRLLAVSDKNCLGTAEVSNVTLVRTVTPTVSITASPITAKECGGEIGSQIEIELTGRPPFAVHYKERNLRFPNSKTVTRVVRTTQRRHSLRITPDLAGTYEFEFFQIDDDNYPSGQPIKTAVKQVVHAQPSAKINAVGGGSIPSRACLGQSVKIPVKFAGQGPWGLTYSIIHDDRRVTKVMEDIADERISLAVGPFEDAGVYAVELLQVRDGNKCPRDLQNVGTSIHVREGGPQAGFKCMDHGSIRALAGKPIRLPIHVTGEAPITVKYRRIDDPDERVFEATIPQKSMDLGQDNYIPAYDPGEYELVAVDDVCPGTVDEDNSRCRVRVEPKPYAWFETKDLVLDNAATSRSAGGVWRFADACQGAADPGILQLGFSGSGPWEIEYLVEHWNSLNPHSGASKYADQSNKRTAVALRPSTLKAEASEPGLYRYTITSVRDQRYQEFQRQPPVFVKNAVSNVTVVEHRVTLGPAAELRAYLQDGTPVDTSSGASAFRRKPKVIKHCLATGQSRSEGDAQSWAKVREHLPVFRIEFDRRGSPPFQAWIEVFPTSGPSEVVQIDDIDSYAQMVSLPDHIAAKTGRYHMRLVKTRDSRGCEKEYVDMGSVGLGREDAGAIEGGIEIEYVEAPSARPASSSPAANPSRNVCVGDIMAFDLRGLSSWTVDYTYNEVHRSAPANKHLFRRLVDVPGNFSIDRVCHRSTNDCCSEFDDLSYAVHDIPRVRVSGGKDVYQDILEGDQVEIRMDLVGAPPFTFTWQRRELGSAKVLESHTVKDLDSTEYKIVTSNEGTFEVTFVRDQYCQYPKA